MLTSDGVAAAMSGREILAMARWGDDCLSESSISRPDATRERHSVWLGLECEWAKAAEDVGVQWRVMPEQRNSYTAALAM